MLKLKKKISGAKRLIRSAHEAREINARCPNSLTVLLHVADRIVCVKNFPQYLTEICYGPTCPCRVSVISIHVGRTVIRKLPEAETQLKIYQNRLYIC